MMTDRRLQEIDAGDVPEQRAIDECVAEIRRLRAEVEQAQAEALAAGQLADTFRASWIESRDRVEAAEARADGYGWRCFKCGMVLKTEAEARNHFGDEACYASLKATSDALRTRLLAADRDLMRFRQERPAPAPLIGRTPDEIVAAFDDAALHPLPDGGLSVLAWAEERHANSVRLASQRTGNDRAGWLEDAAYWSAIVDALRAMAQPPACRLSGFTGRKR